MNKDPKNNRPKKKVGLQCCIGDFDFDNNDDDFEEEEHIILFEKYFSNSMDETDVAKLTEFLKTDPEAGSKLASYLIDCIAFDVVAREICCSSQA